MQLSIRNLTKTYGNKRALDKLSVELTPGIYGLLGPNGAGKSTLMNIIADNLAADSGEIRYNERAIIEMGKSFRAVFGYMPQHQGMYDGFTALRFMHYMATLKGMKAKDANKSIPDLLSRVGLYDERDKKLKTFSGGMKQRILIAQALLNSPEVIVFDEPTAGLDPKQRVIIRNLISEVSINKIVLIATHVVSDIEFIAKEILMLNHGVLLTCDTIPNLLKMASGKVFEILADESEFFIIKQKYRVCNVSKSMDGLSIRIVSDTEPEGYRYNSLKPSLEDVYMYLFDVEEEI